MTSGSLHRLVYMSTAVGVLRADELDRIYLRAQAANKPYSLTGLLLFYEGSFLQLVEGPVAGISSLMQKVRRDRRHTGLITLESGPIETRSFPDSPMHFVSGRNLTPGEKQAFSDLRQAVMVRPNMVGSPAPGADNGLLTFLSSFAIPRTA
ncbi:MAG TPA: BLUF domain-containing protein [Hyphomonadaceae bacterium]|nr:BLUF domain-containing protein [Hyphomonadaceae bacterium]